MVTLFSFSKLHLWLKGLAFSAFAFAFFIANGQSPQLALQEIAKHTEGDLRGCTTYQLVLENLPSQQRVVMVYGNKSHPLYIKSSKPFWNSSFGKAVCYGVNVSYQKLDSNIVYDSWVTIQSDFGCSDCPAVMSVEAPNEKWIEPFNAGNNIVISSDIGGAWFVTDKYEITNNKVLLGQFTTKGNLEVLLNVTLISESSGEKTELTGLSVQEN